MQSRTHRRRLAGALGALAVLASALCWALLSISNRQLATRESPAVMLFYTLPVSGVLAVLAYGALLRRKLPPDEDPQRELRDFSEYVFVDAQDTWQAIFKQAGWRRAEIESPCIKICVVHPEAREAVYRNRRRIGGARGKRLMRRRGELLGTHSPMIFTSTRLRRWPSNSP